MGPGASASPGLRQGCSTSFNSHSKFHVRVWLDDSADVLIRRTALYIQEILLRGHTHAKQPQGLRPWGEPARTPGLVLTAFYTLKAAASRCLPGRLSRPGDHRRASSPTCDFSRPR